MIERRKRAAEFVYRDAHVAVHYALHDDDRRIGILGQYALRNL